MQGIVLRPEDEGDPDQTADGVATAIETAGDAWSWLVLRGAIVGGMTRFDQFQRNLGIARSTLTTRLNNLCQSGLLTKVNRATVAKPEYLLTPVGTAFTPCLLMAMNWGDRWLPAPEGPPLVVEHLACGAKSRVDMCCRTCAQPVQARDVEFANALPVSTPPTHGRSRAPGLELLERVRPCSIARTLRVTGDRWSGLVLRGEFFGMRRFDEFEQALGIAPNILSQRLNRLVRLEVLRKSPIPDSRPRRHEYRLTAKGRGLYPMYVAMLTWGNEWLSANTSGPKLRHTSCGEPLNAFPSCADCGAEVERDDLRFHDQLANGFED